MPELGWDRILFALFVSLALVAFGGWLDHREAR